MASPHCWRSRSGKRMHVRPGRRCASGLVTNRERPTSFENGETETIGPQGGLRPWYAGVGPSMLAVLLSTACYDFGS